MGDAYHIYPDQRPDQNINLFFIFAALFYHCAYQVFGSNVANGLI